MRMHLTAALVFALAIATGPPDARAAGDVGSVAPDFLLENVLDGTPDTFTLSEHRGSVVVIAFFAWW